jgi:hypothetical protein
MEFVPEVKGQPQSLTSARSTEKRDCTPFSDPGGTMERQHLKAG